MKLRRTFFGISVGGGTVAKFLGAIGRADEGFVLIGPGAESGGVALEESLFGGGIVATRGEDGNCGCLRSLIELLGGGRGCGGGGAPSSSRGGPVGFAGLVRIDTA